MMWGYSCPLKFPSNVTKPAIAPIHCRDGRLCCLYHRWSTFKQSHNRPMEGRRGRERTGLCLNKHFVQDWVLDEWSARPSSDPVCLITLRIQKRVEAIIYLNYEYDINSFKINLYKFVICLIGKTTSKSH